MAILALYNLWTGPGEKVGVEKHFRPPLDTCILRNFGTPPLEIADPLPPPDIFKWNSPKLLGYIEAMLL